VKRIATVVVVCFLALSAAHLSAALAAKASIVGKWEATKGVPLPPGALMEFTADKKIVVHVPTQGKVQAFPYGSYEIKGDKITMVADKSKETEVDTIKELTAERMVLVDPKGKTAEFRRAKP
jgi:uncharacterized protein (TIGR03066 family)